MSVINLENECFNFELACIVSEQNAYGLYLSENLSILNEKENILDKISNSIAKIFDNIAMFIDKIIQTVKKKFSTIGLKSAKEKLTKIKNSTKDITTDGEVELKFNNANYITKQIIHDNDLHELTGIENIEEPLWEPILIKSNSVSPFMKFIKDKNASIKKYVMTFFCKSMGIKDAENVQKIIENENSSEKVKHKDMKTKIKIVENQLNGFDDFLNKDYNKCLSELLIVRNGCRKQATQLRSAGIENKISLNAEKRSNATCLFKAANAYSNLVHIETQYLFATIRIQMSCIKHNITEMSKILL